MKKKYLPLIALFTVLISCQREVLTEQSTDDEPGILLEKTISLSGHGYVDSLIISYEYDNNQKLIAEDFRARVISGGVLQERHFSTRYSRNQNGRIIQIERSGPYSDANPGSAVTFRENVTYENEPLGRVAFIIDNAGAYRFNFFYDANGHIIKTETHSRTSPSDPLQLAVYHIHQYDGSGNLVSREEFSDSDNNGIFEKTITARFQYDNKINPLYPADDVLLEWRWAQVSPANCIVQQNDYSDPSSPDDSVSEVFQYRPDGKPVSSVFTRTNGDLTKRTYYYR